MLGVLDAIAGWFGAQLTAYLGKKIEAQGTAMPTDTGLLMGCLQRGDVVLVEGKTRVSVAIKFLTQSTWSHAALYVGNDTGLVGNDGLPGCFLEADIREGVRAVGPAEFEGLHCRVCRPVGLTSAETDAVIAFIHARLGYRYDMRNVFDLLRYLLPNPPVPVRWRRRMLALGSGDPTRAICSTLIAQAFQSVHYPILPIVDTIPANTPGCSDCVDEIFHIRHHSLFVPRDFDVSPYFAIIKPSLAAGFDHLAIRWHVPTAAEEASEQPEPATAMKSEPR